MRDFKGVFPIYRIKHLFGVVECMFWVAIIICSCAKKQEPVTTPWGTVLGDTTTASASGFSLDDIINNGELIVLTISGPDTYYDYQGHGMGDQYLLCEKFAKEIGVSVRIDVCRDTTEMIERLNKGEGDLIAVMLSKKGNDKRGLLFCGTQSANDISQWAVAKNSTQLAEALNQWFKPSFLSQIKREEEFLLSTRSIRRRVYSPMLNRAQGVISRYDAIFKQYAAMARVDWRLMAAQCYQESCFDPNARSWAGAGGLMQIMPSTADHLGLPRNMIFEPEANIAAASRYLLELGMKFRDIPSPEQRLYFTLACYNGGYFHVRDAMALAKKYGRNPMLWEDVSVFIEQLSLPRFYQDPVVKYGYMRGYETVDYVRRIKQRYLQYRSVTGGGGSLGIGGGSENLIPHRSKHKNKYRI